MSDGEDVADTVERLQGGGSKRIGAVEDQNEWLEQEIKALGERIDDLERRLDRRDELTELLTRVEGGAAGEPEQRAAVREWCFL